ncbi:MAG: RNA polymerase sigma factor [Planctomycetota bacterium]|jgi:RNA polymerase sigma-70 factor (ECF subfamily)
MVETDAKLVNMSLNGNQKAFSALVDRYHGRVCGIAYSQLRDMADAEDAAQETFIAAFRSLSKLSSADKFGPWVARIAFNTCKDHLRRKKRKTYSLDNLQEQGVIGTSVSEAIRKGEQLDKIITAAIHDLPARTQAAVVLRFYDNKSYAEIAEMLGIPVSTVRGALYRGTKHLREKLHPHMAQ